ncbi:MAG: hypothetical protein E6I97_02535 [Chloroflexi bacterium]|nr:MAG: hypothetical protein E6I97_02535 [Chloroflexota bacterium]
MRRVRAPRPRGQNWATFLHNHAQDVWACDFLQITDLFFRPLFAFFIIERKIPTSDACWHNTIPYRRLGGAAASRSDSLWASTEVPHLCVITRANLGLGSLVWLQPVP